MQILGRRISKEHIGKSNTLYKYGLHWQRRLYFDFNKNGMLFCFSNVHLNLMALLFLSSFYTNGVVTKVTSKVTNNLRVLDICMYVRLVSLVSIYLYALKLSFIANYREVITFNFPFIASFRVKIYTCYEKFIKTFRVEN